LRVFAILMSQNRELTGNLTAVASFENRPDFSTETQRTRRIPEA
jgi:hypothetical protein